MPFKLRNEQQILTPLDPELSPLAVAILRRSAEDVRSALTKYPHSILERTYNLTVLHLSSGWPMGLSILLCAGAAGLIDEVCSERASHRTVLDFAFYFDCEEAVAVLFDAGCSWNGFHNSYPVTASVACVRTAARKLACRRQSLMGLAEQTLTEPQLANVRPGTGVLDLNAAAVVQLLRKAGVDVPTHLAVPDSYATVYVSENVDIAFFPIFFSQGFHDVNNRAGERFAPIQLAWLDNRKPPTDDRAVDERLFGSDLLQWLESHGFLDLAPANVQSLETNTQATGWHILATRMAWKPLNENTISYFPDVIASRASDGCRCACSNTGCLPLTTALKTTRRYPKSWWRKDSELWEMVQGETAGELLRFLTFEALEMTHTCCKDIRVRPPGYYSLRLFEGSVEEIHDEEQELHRRLEELLSEFGTHLEDSGEGLRDFVWGFWRERMAEECIPVRDEDDVIGVESGISFRYNCKSTYTDRNMIKGSQGDRRNPACSPEHLG